MPSTDKPTEGRNRFDRDHIRTVMETLIAKDDGTPLTPTEALFVAALAEGATLAEAMRLALGEDIADSMNAAAVRMAATQASRRPRVQSALATEMQRRILLHLPTALKVQADLAQNATTESVRERASRNLAAWSGLGAMTGTDPDRENTPRIDAAKASVNINT